MHVHENVVRILGGYKSLYTPPCLRPWQLSMSAEDHLAMMMPLCERDDESFPGKSS